MESTYPKMVFSYLRNLRTESHFLRIWKSVLVVNQILQSCIRLSPHGPMLSGFQFPACDDPATFVHTLSKCTWFSRLAHWPWKNAIPCNSLSESEITCTSGSAMASPMGRLKCLRLSSGCQSPSSCCDSATTITVVAAVFPLGSHGMSPNDLVMARPWRFNQCYKHHVLVKPNRLNLAKPHLGSGLQPFTLVVEASLQSVSTFIKHGQPKKLQRRQPPTTLPKAWYSLLAALFMELGFVEVATRQAPRTCDRTGAWKQVSYLWAKDGGVTVKNGNTTWYNQRKWWFKRQNAVPPLWPKGSDGSYVVVLV